MGKKPQIIAQYTHPSQFEPLLPQQHMDELRKRTRAVVEKSFQLTSRAHPATVASLRELVRAMNSYYSNRIEGQSTHPLNIARALRKDFSDKPDVAQLQRLALAHIEAERVLEQQVAEGEEALSSAFLVRVRIPMNSATHSNTKPASDSNRKTATHSDINPPPADVTVRSHSVHIPEKLII